MEPKKQSKFNEKYTDRIKAIKNSEQGRKERLRMAKETEKLENDEKAKFLKNEVYKKDK